MRTDCMRCVIDLCAFSSDDLSLRVSDVTSASGERRVTVVRLEKDDDVGIGLTIVGGENTGKKTTVTAPLF